MKSLFYTEYSKPWRNICGEEGAFVTAWKMTTASVKTHMAAKCNQWVINVCPLHYKKQRQALNVCSSSGQQLWLWLKTLYPNNETYPHPGLLNPFPTNDIILFLSHQLSRWPMKRILTHFLAVFLQLLNCWVGELECWKVSFYNHIWSTNHCVVNNKDGSWHFKLVFHFCSVSEGLRALMRVAAEQSLRGWESEGPLLSPPPTLFN